MRAKKREDGRYAATVRHNGKKKFFYGKTQKEALAKKAAFLDTIAKCPNFDSNSILSDWLDEYLLDAKKRVTRASYISYESIIRVHLRPALGHFTLKELQPPVIRHYFDTLADNGKSNRTIEYIHTILKAVLELAVNDGFLIRNPAKAIRHAKVTKKEKAILSTQQLKKLLCEINNVMLKRLVYVAANTGLRREELLAIRIKDINLFKPSITISQTVHYDHGETYITNTAKNKSSLRTIAIDRATLQIIKDQIAYVEDLKNTTFGYKDTGLLFPNQTGLPLFPAYVSRIIKEAAIKANLPANFSFHSLRHTHATLLLQEGVDVKSIQQRLGHSSAKTTMDIYSHVTPKMEKRVVAAIENITKVE